MPRIKLISNNKRKAILASGIVFIFCMTTIFFPLLLMRLIPQSGIGNYFLDHMYYAYITMPLILYILYIGIFWYQIKIDSYIVDVRSSRIIFGVFRPLNYIDISHTMLSDFSFFNRPFS